MAFLVGPAGHRSESRHHYRWLIPVSKCPDNWRPGAAVVRLLALAAVVALVLVVAFGGASGLGNVSQGGPVRLLIACLVYAALLAVPFVPAVEIGLLIMVVFGKAGAVGAYLATVVGLNLAYGAGRFLESGIDDGQVRLPAGVSTRLQALTRDRPKGSLPIVALVLLLNLPAGTVFGGGGGVALVYGATRALSWPSFAATVAIATAVVPTLFLAGVVGAEHLFDGRPNQS